MNWTWKKQVDIYLMVKLCAICVSYQWRLLSLLKPSNETVSYVWPKEKIASFSIYLSSICGGLHLKSCFWHKL
jgi:hypothetical protein